MKEWTNMMERLEGINLTSEKNTVISKFKNYGKGHC
jgi:hypothetical protein